MDKSHGAPFAINTRDLLDGVVKANVQPLSQLVDDVPMAAHHEAMAAVKGQLLIRPHCGYLLRAGSKPALPPGATPHKQRTTRPWPERHV